MRYAALTAVVLGSAMILVPGSLASAQDAPKTETKPLTSISQIINSDDAQVKVKLTASSESTGEPEAKLAAATDADKPAPAPAPPIVEVTVNPGDNLSKIAAAHGTTAQRLYDANPGVPNPHQIEPGWKIRIPDANETLTTREMPAMPAPAPTPAAPAASAPAARSYAPVASSAPAVASGSVWDRLAQCESGGNWAINTGNGFFGGLQFTLATWQAVGGTGYPHQNSREEQIKRAEILLARSGWGQWPACTAKLGLR